MGEVVVIDHPLKYIYDWFVDTNPTGYGWGPVKITYAELESFSRLRKLKLRPWEAELIVDLSILNVEVYHYKKNNPSLPKGYAPVSGPQGVKAMFSKLAKSKEK